MCTYFKGAVKLQISRNENYTIITALTFLLNQKLKKSLILLQFACVYSNFTNKNHHSIEKISMKR